MKQKLVSSLSPSLLAIALKFDNIDQYELHWYELHWYES